MTRQKTSVPIPVARQQWPDRRPLYPYPWSLFHNARETTHYHLPSNDTPTFNGHTVVYLLSYCLLVTNNKLWSHIRTHIKWPMQNNESGLPGLKLGEKCGGQCWHTDVTWTCVYSNSVLWAQHWAQVRSVYFDDLFTNLLWPNFTTKKRKHAESSERGL